MIRTDDQIENPTVFRPHSHCDTPESRTKSSSKSSPEIIAVKNKETITWNDSKNLPEEKCHPRCEENLTPDDGNTGFENSDLAYIPSDFLKHQYPLKTEWDGSILDFNEYKSQMEGFYILVHV